MAGAGSPTQRSRFLFPAAASPGGRRNAALQRQHDGPDTASTEFAPATIPTPSSLLPKLDFFSKSARRI